MATKQPPPKANGTSLQVPPFGGATSPNDAIGTLELSATKSIDLPPEHLLDSTNTVTTEDAVNVSPLSGLGNK